ncbi:MAG TPA: GNAT family N-acetyltransferase [candidate division Zixibacteria bacterium]|nr:GNAT family N-acetyltransferase [candidate division Zixibacteria bacterium]
MSYQFTLQRLESGDTRPSFDCGDSDLNEFFAVDSKIAGNELMSVTYIAEIDRKAAAYFSLSNDAIKRELVPKSVLRRIFKKIPQPKRYKSMPAVKIGRLATCVEMQCKNIGTDILDYLKVWFTDGNKTGCRFIVVDAYNTSRAIKFYTDNGFDFLMLEDESDETRLMYFDLIKFREA